MICPFCNHEWDPYEHGWVQMVYIGGVNPLAYECPKCKHQFQTLPLDCKA